MSSFWLEYTENGQRREFSFDASSVSIGRDKSSDFVLDHPTVSRQHALIVGGPGGYQLVVLSRGGLTAIDGGQVSGEVQLFDGSQINFGQLTFVFRSPGAPAKPQGYGNSTSGAWQQQQSPQSGSWQQQQSPQSGSWQQQQSPQSGSWQQQSPQSGSWQQQQPQGGNDGWNPQETGWAGQDGGLDESSDGLMSWDQIAASAEEEEAKARSQMSEADQALTDFERIQAAQAKLDSQAKGSPLLTIVGLLAIAGMVGWFFWPASGPIETDEVDVDSKEVEFIEWAKGDISCVGEADCLSQAEASHQLAMKTLDQQDADIANLYVAYRALDKAERLLLEGGLTDPPKDLKNLGKNKTIVKGELDAIFQQRRINFREYQGRKMHEEMANALSSIKAYFPDKRCRYHQWALQKERDMKDNGIYPRRFKL